MKRASILTTTEAAELAAVAPSTIKRWADQGILPFSTTVGGHRRFQRFAVERFLREQQAAVSSSDPVAAAWVRGLVDGLRHEIDGRLVAARNRLGCWWQVADELGVALAEIGRRWECGSLTVAEEHLASEALARALVRVGDALPLRLEGPKCVLACVAEEEHTLGLSLAELCLRELGWTPLWLGRRTPVAEVVRVVRGGGVSMVALSASAQQRDEWPLRSFADEVGAACRELDIGLCLGGAGAWPVPPPFGVRVTSFAAFRDYLEEGNP